MKIGITLSIFALINIISFFVYFIDKRFAIKEKRRISEKTLILFALFFGAVGAFLSMNIFHHKTHKAKFLISIPLCLILNFVAIYFIIIQF